MYRILLSNDDGIDEPGLRALASALEPVGKLCIVAPDRDRSGTGHAITVRESLQVQRVGFPGDHPAFSVSGTPADCVKLGILELFEEPPDLVVSGINAGANLGIDVFYSGTVAAAAEAALLGIPAIAVSSITEKSAPRFAVAQEAARLLAERMRECPGSPGPLLLNVNVPDDADGAEGRLVWTRIGLNRRYRDRYARRSSEDGQHHFQLGGEADEGDRDDPASDAGAVHRGFVSVTPVQFDVTDYGWLRALGVRPGLEVGAVTAGRPRSPLDGRGPAA